MSTTRTKGATLIELIITTAVVAVILSAVYMLWASNTATARQCSSLVNNLSQGQMLCDQLRRQLDNLVYDISQIPVISEIHSGKVKIKLHTRFNSENDTNQPCGPFIAEYELDIPGKIMKYRQRAALNFNEEINDNSKWLESKTTINNIVIEYSDGENWYKYNELDNKTEKNKPITMIRATIQQETSSGQMQYNTTISRASILLASELPTQLEK